MRKDYSRYVSKLSYTELSKKVKKLGSNTFRGIGDQYYFFEALCYEKDKRDEVEKEFLNREEVSKFELIDI